MLALAIEQDREGEIAKRLPLSENAEAVSEILDVRLLGLVNEHVARIRLSSVVAHLRDETGLRHIEVTAALGHFFASLVGRQGSPFGAHDKAGRNLEESVKH